MNSIILPLLIVGIAIFPMIVMGKNAPQFPEVSSQYLLTTVDREVIKRLYSMQHSDIVGFQDSITSSKPKQTVANVVSILEDSNALHNCYSKPICEINRDIVAYSNQFAKLKVVKSFDEKTVLKIADISKFAEQYRLQPFLHNLNYPYFLENIVHIKDLSDGKLKVFNDMLRDTKTHIANAARTIEPVCETLFSGMTEFIQASQAIRSTLQQLHETIDSKADSVKGKRNKLMKDLEKHIEECSSTMSKWKQRDQSTSHVSYKNVIRESCDIIDSELNSVGRIFKGLPEKIVSAIDTKKNTVGEKESDILGEMNRAQKGKLYYPSKTFNPETVELPKPTSLRSKLGDRLKNKIGAKK